MTDTLIALTQDGVFFLSSQKKGWFYYVRLIIPSKDFLVTILETLVKPDNKIKIHFILKAKNENESSLKEFLANLTKNGVSILESIVDDLYWFY